MILAGLVAARFLHHAALMLLFGAAAFQLFAGQASERAAAGTGPHALELRHSLFWSSLGALAGALLVLGFTAANLAGSLGTMVDPLTLRTILLDTDFGRVWAFRLGVAALLAAWFSLRRRVEASRREAWLVLLLAGALLTTVALTGHAQTRTGIAGLAHRTADAGHLVASAVWLGALPPFLLLLDRSRTASGDGALAAGRLLRRFHRVGVIAVAVLLATGLVNSWFLVGGPGALLTTTYGRVLLVKLALFAAMTGLAVGNRLRLVPGLRAALAQGLPAELWLERLRAHVRWEFLLGLGVLSAIAVLGAIAPAITDHVPS